MPDLEPTLEIVIPFYGEPGYLREAVESVLTQSDRDWTLRVIDDCYPDPTAAAFVAYLDDPRVNLTRNAENLGAQRTYQLAIDSSKADYVVLLGADDRLLPNYVARWRSTMSHSQTTAEVYHPNVAVIDDKGQRWLPLGDRVKRLIRPRGGSQQIQGDPGLASFLVGDWAYFPAIAWHVPTIRKIGFRRYDVVQDLALIGDVLLGDGLLVIDDETSFEYRRHPQSDSAYESRTGKRFHEEKSIIRELTAAAHARGWQRSVRAGRGHLTSRANAALMAAASVRTGRFRIGRDLLRHALQPLRLT